MKSKKQIYNLKTGRPKVLLLGNGLTRKSGGLSWNEALLQMSKEYSTIEAFMKDSNHVDEGFIIPSTPLALVTAPVNDAERRKKYVEVFRKKDCQVPSLLYRLTKMPFTAFLTTNYTYEVENALFSGFSELSLSAQTSKSQSFHNGTNKDQNLIERCTLLYPSAPQIWHIHGEINRKSSIVLTHDEYARLVTSMISYLREQKNRYSETMEQFEFRSWIDYLLMADVYVLGLGFEFSEFDLWWMLGRRMREKAPTGRIVFYEHRSESNRGKQQALAKLRVKVESLGFERSDRNNEDSDTFYREFYEEAARDIEENLLKQEVYRYV